MKRVIYFLSALLLTVGCAGYEEVDIVTDAPEVFTADVEESCVRLYIDDNKLYWHNSDEISIFAGTTKNLKYKFEGETGSRTGKFSCVTSNTSGGTALDCNYAIYPYSALTTMLASGNIEYSLSSSQKYAENSFAPNANIMVAATENSDNTHFQFKNVVGYLKLQLYGNNTSVKTITLTGNKSEKLTGNATITASFGKEPTLTLDDNATNKVTLNCESAVKLSSDSAKPTEFWFALPPVTFSEGFTITVTDSEGNQFKKSTSKKVVIARNTILPMQSIEVVTKATTGSTLPAWSEGYLDIHFINAGRGECCFYILPDGTTMLVDAGEVKTNNLKEGNENYPDDLNVEQKPNASVRPYMVYANYIKHFMPNGQTAINWCAPSHFHIDHIGEPKTGTENHPVAGYHKTGLMALFDEVPFHRVIDRAYPDYVGDDTTAPLEGGLAQDWADFVKYHIEEGNIAAGYRFTPGEEKITLRYNKAAYSNFRIFNICANGFVWNKRNGAGYLAGSRANEGNPASCGFHISYGDFDYVACGDLTSSPQNLAAYYVRDFIGGDKLDAFKTHHHLSGNSWGSKTQTIHQPQVILSHSFYYKQPDTGILQMLFDYTWQKNFFVTNLHSMWKSNNGTLLNDDDGEFTGSEGHIVLRVAPGGKTFYVYMLDDTNFEYKIKSIHGPYTSK